MFLGKEIKTLLELLAFGHRNIAFYIRFGVDEPFFYTSWTVNLVDENRLRYLFDFRLFLENLIVCIKPIRHMKPRFNGKEVQWIGKVVSMVRRLVHVRSKSQNDSIKAAFIAINHVAKPFCGLARWSAW